MREEIIKIGSLNVDALGSRAYTTKVLMLDVLIQTHKLDAIMIQDTHSAPGSTVVNELIRKPQLDFANHCPYQGTKKVTTIINKRNVCFLQKAVIADDTGRLLVSTIVGC